MQHPADIIRAVFDAYASNDRATVEALIAEDFTFTSPYDRAIDRAAYFERCWPNSARIRRPHLTDIAGAGSRWFVRYELELHSGETFTNTEVFTVVDGQVRSVEVFFGDLAPRRVHPGDASHVDSAPSRSTHG